VSAQDVSSVVRAPVVQRDDGVSEIRHRPKPSGQIGGAVANRQQACQQRPAQLLALAKSLMNGKNAGHPD
jgi:hypothetical protein